jgi:hypothetical protein
MDLLRWADLNCLRTGRMRESRKPKETKKNLNQNETRPRQKHPAGLLKRAGMGNATKDT